MISIFGGTFDPVHLGHLAVARDVRKTLDSCDFRFLPARQPPHRAGTHASAEQRLEMLHLAMESENGFSIDEREMKRSGPSYMVDTLQSIREESPGQALVLVVGQDAANGFDRWHRWQEIMDLASLAVMTRAGELPDYQGELARFLVPRFCESPRPLHEHEAGLVVHVEVGDHHISSTRVRERVAQGLSIDELVPAPVAAYIGSEGLYR